MPNVGIQETTPNSGLEPDRLSARLSSSVINASVKDDVPNVKTERFTAFSTTEPSGIVAGNPIGLLLALTYAGDPGDATFLTIGKKPNVAIRDLNG